MSYKPNIEIRDKYVVVSHEASEGGNTEPMSFASELADACDNAGLHRVLLDERNVIYTVGNIFDLMGMGDKLLEERLGRNDPCPCGSNKRFKNCCLKSGRF